MSPYTYTDDVGQNLDETEAYTTPPLENEAEYFDGALAVGDELIDEFDSDPILNVMRNS